MSPKTSPPNPVRRRDVANMRERRRMTLINRGFDLLKQRLPMRHLMRKDKSHVRLTKVDILRMTIQYIKQLLALLDNQHQQEVGDQVKLKLDSGQSFPNESRTMRNGRCRRQCRGSQSRLRSARTQMEEAAMKQKRDRPELTVDCLESTNVHIETQPDKRNMRLICKSSQDGDSSECCYLLSWSRCRKLETASQYDINVVPSDGQARKLRNTKLWIPEPDESKKAAD